MTASPIEARALSLVRRLPRIRALMRSQLAKGREGYGHAIDDCGYSRARMLSETGCEGSDLIVYLEALNAPAEVLMKVVSVCGWLEAELAGEGVEV